jgi:predicted transcriptional regulator
LNKEEYHRAQGEAFVEKAYGGSLPKMIAAFIQSKKLSAAQIAEIEAMIEDYKS